MLSNKLSCIALSIIIFLNCFAKYWEMEGEAEDALRRKAEDGLRGYDSFFCDEMRRVRKEEHHEYSLAEINDTLLVYAEKRSGLDYIDEQREKLSDESRDVLTRCVYMHNYLSRIMRLRQAELGREKTEERSSKGGIEIMLEETDGLFHDEINNIRWDENYLTKADVNTLENYLEQYFQKIRQVGKALSGRKINSHLGRLFDNCTAKYGYLSGVINEEINRKKRKFKKG
jgi:hypothetical protein